MKKNQNFEIVAGDSAKLNVTITDRFGPMNLADVTIKWVLWYNLNQMAVLIKNSSSGISITNALAGLCKITLEPADTLTLAAGTYSHECEVTDASGNVSTVLTGTVTILQSRI